MISFQDDTVIVTGAARGVGAATARTFAKGGARVAVCDILEQGAEIATELERSFDARARFYKLDVAVESDWKNVTKSVAEQLGTPTVLVNNAGGGTGRDLDTETLEGWDYTVALCQMGAWLGMREVVPYFLSLGRGAIVNVGSVYAHLGGFGGSVAYHSAKAGLIGLTRNASLRYARDGIRVNMVHPGFVDTAMNESTKGTPRGAEILANTPMGRLADPEELASAICFLASSAASFITGAELMVDGGWSAR
jgi:NAD(P)-dependent dehydrogenase (short-subunit alcohol dehydrogenase family)